jgi:hypothetical protein
MTPKVGHQICQLTFTALDFTVRRMKQLDAFNFVVIGAKFTQTWATKIGNTIAAGLSMKSTQLMRNSSVFLQSLKIITSRAGDSWSLTTRLKDFDFIYTKLHHLKVQINLTYFIIN